MTSCFYWCVYIVFISHHYLKKGMKRMNGYFTFITFQVRTTINFSTREENNIYEDINKIFTIWSQRFSCIKIYFYVFFWKIKHKNGISYQKNVHFLIMGIKIQRCGFNIEMLSFQPCWINCQLVKDRIKINKDVKAYF